MLRSLVRSTVPPSADGGSRLFVRLTLSWLLEATTMTAPSLAAIFATATEDDDPLVGQIHFQLPFRLALRTPDQPRAVFRPLRSGLSPPKLLKLTLVRFG